MSRKGKKEQDGKIIKDSLFPVSLFVIYLGVVCLMSGVHQGLLVLMHQTWMGRAGSDTGSDVLLGAGCRRPDFVYKKKDQRDL